MSLSDSIDSQQVLKANTIVKRILGEGYYAEDFGVKAVGVKGDERAYEGSIAVVGKAKQDPNDPTVHDRFLSELAEVSSEICNDVIGVSRVVWIDE